MKKRLLAVAVAFLGVVGLVSLSFAWDVKVTIRNTTKYHVNVEVYKDPGGTPELACWLQFYRDDIGKTQMCTTRFICPGGMKGLLAADDGNKKLAPMSLLGHETDIFTAVCWDTSWTICRKRGNEGETIKDYDFGFCKQ